MGSKIVLHVSIANVHWWSTILSPPPPEKNSRASRPSIVALTILALVSHHHLIHEYLRSQMPICYAPIMCHPCTLLFYIQYFACLCLSNVPHIWGLTPSNLQLSSTFSSPIIIWLLHISNYVFPRNIANNYNLWVGNLCIPTTGLIWRIGEGS